MIFRSRKVPQKALSFMLLCTLAIIAGAFSFPAEVRASPVNIAPPSVHAEITGSLLRIEATDGFYPVEAIFINGRRFNFRVDSALLIDVSQYVAAGDSIAVYAVDFAGNVSSTVLLTPPPPMLPPQPNNLTPEGQGQVIDHATSADNIEFITINTPAGNTFFLVIDHTRGGNNVYFLNAATEWDLLTLAADAELPTPPQFAEPPPPPPPVIVQEIPPQPEPVPIDEGGGNLGMIIFMVIAGGGVFAVAYYFKILKPKQAKQTEDDDEDEDEDDEYEDFDDSEDEEIEESEDSENSENESTDNQHRQQ